MKKIVLALSLLVCLFGVSNLFALEVAPKVGSLSPALELPDINNKIVSLADLIGTKKTIICFGASWSQNCQDEFIKLGELAKQNSKSCQVIVISFDKKAKDLKAFVEKNDLTFPILQDKKLSTLDRFQILILPTTFCLNEQGVIDKIFVDFDENIEKALAAWLK